MSKIINNMLIFLDKENANDLRIIGNKYVKEEKYKQAINMYTEAIKISNISNEDLSKIYCNRLYCYYKQKLFEKALQDGYLSIELNTNWFKPHYRIGEIYLEMNKIDEALKYFYKAKTLSKDNNKEILETINKAEYIKKENERFIKIKQGDITIEYGIIKLDHYYHEPAFFLNVNDKRLCIKNNVSNEIDIDGTYLKIHTLPFINNIDYMMDYAITLNGRKVSKETMFYFYKEYGIDCKIFGKCFSCDNEYLEGICLLCQYNYCKNHKFKERICKKCDHNPPNIPEDPWCHPSDYIIFGVRDKIRNGNYKPIYLLVFDVFHNEIPTNYKVLKDYGFDKCKNYFEKSKLLGVYIGLIKHICCDIEKLHESCESNNLWKFIDKEYDIVKKSGNYIGEYYPWIEKNKHILNNEK